MALDLPHQKRAVRVGLLARLALLPWLGTNGGVLAAAASDFPPPLPALTNAASVLALSKSEAMAGYPASIQGVVILYDHAGRHFFVQDATASLPVSDGEQDLKLTSGTQVVLKGVTGKGWFSPVLRVLESSVTGHGPMPTPRRVAAAQLRAGSVFGQWVEIEGCVVGYREFEGKTQLDLVSDFELATATIGGRPEELTMVRPGAVIRMRGVPAPPMASQSALEGMVLHVPAASEIDLLQPAPLEPFSGQRVAIEELKTPGFGVSATPLVRVQGIVSAVLPGGRFFLNGSSGSLRVNGFGDQVMIAGTTVEAVGVPTWAGGFATLRPVALRMGEVKPLPEPIPWKAGLVPGRDLDGRRVRIQGEVISGGGFAAWRRSMILRHGTAFAEIRMATGRGEESAGFSPGMGVIATGVCELPSALGGATNWFTLWIESPGDVVAAEDELAASPAWLIATAMLAIAALLLWLSRRESARGWPKSIGAAGGAGRDSGTRSPGSPASPRWAVAFRELALLMVIAAAVFMLGSQFDTADRLLEFARRHEAWQIDELFVLAFILAALFAVFAWRRWREMRREMVLREQATEALLASEARLRRSIEERERIGQDLHDGIIQSIYAVGLNLDACRRRLSDVPQPLDEVMQRCRDDLNGVIRDLRSYITGMEPKALEGRELAPALQSLALTLTQPDGLQFVLRIDPVAAGHLDSRQATQFLHIAREAMTNSLRHSKASRAWVRLGQVEGRVRLEIEDDGAGFDPSRAANASRGLRNLSARAHDLGTEMQLVSNPGNGTRIRIEVPVETQQDYERTSTDQAAAGG